MVIDIAFYILIIIAIFKGFSKGLIVGIFSFLAFIIGIAAALKLSALVAQYLGDATGTAARWIPVASFAIVFIVVVLLVNLGAAIIKRTVKLAMLGWLDKLGGIILYAILYTIIFSIIVFFAEQVFLISPETVAASGVHKYIAPWGPNVIDNLGRIIPVFQDLFVELQLFFEKMGEKIVG